ncbi:hypothetical protein [Bradyrhizobium sp. USDA 10063]
MCGADGPAGRAGLRFCVGDSTVTAGKVTLDCARAIVMEEEQPASRTAVPMKKFPCPRRRRSVLTFTSIHFQDEFCGGAFSSRSKQKEQRWN